MLTVIYLLFIQSCSYFRIYMQLIDGLPLSPLVSSCDCVDVYSKEMCILVHICNLCSIYILWNGNIILTWRLSHHKNCYKYPRHSHYAPVYIHQCVVNDDTNVSKMSHWSVVVVVGRTKDQNIIESDANVHECKWRVFVVDNDDRKKEVGRKCYHLKINILPSYHIEEKQK